MVIEKKRKRSEASRPIKPVVKASPAASTSLLKADEAFPRGGGSVLTPFEYKEATNEAKRDALFEEASESASKQVRRKKSSNVDTTDSTRDGPKIEGLSFKRLSAGTLVLGQVTSINNLDIVISLPNNLSGYVSITNISPLISAGLEQSDVISNGEESEQTTPELSEIFEIGQWIRAAVIAISPGTSRGKSGRVEKKRIDLSLEPSIVNKGLLPAYLQNREVLQASVKSIEDHGLVMDLGIEGCSGFIKNKELGSLKSDSVKHGQVILCSVTAISEERNVVQLSAHLEKDPKRLKLKSIINIDAVLPGDGIEILVTEAHPTSFSGNVLGLLNATCDLFHSGSIQNEENRPSLGDRVFGRVLFIDPEIEPKRISVSILPHVVGFGQVSSSPTSIQNPLEATPIGFVFDQVTVKHVESRIGLFCETSINGVLGFVHISRISEGKIDSLSPSTGKYKTGSQHQARIIGYNAVDGLYLLSLEQHVIDMKYLNVGDISIGELVRGTIEKFVQGGVLVKLSENLTGLVPDSHITDVKLQFPEKKFKVGLEVQCRVLDTDPVRRRFTMTMKKSLVNSDAPVISSFEETEVGTKSPGVISKLFDNGALVQFYAGVHGFLPSSEMSEAYIANPKEHFRIGQTLSVHVLKIDAEEHKMTLSCKDTITWDEDKLTAFDSVEIGSICSATITEKTPDKLIVSLKPSEYMATIEIGHFSDGDFAKCDKLFQRARVGGHLKEVVILDKRVQQRQLVVSLKPSLLNASKERALLVDFETINVGQKYSGFVRKAMDYGVLVGFANGLTGLALKHNLSNDYVSMPASIFSAAQSVSCTVIEVDADQKRFQVSLKQEKSGAASDLTSPELTHPVDAKIDSISDISPGKTLMARISSVKDTQLNLEFADSIQGRIDVSSLYDSFDEIRSKRHPLKHFKAGEEINVKVVGFHDARNHKFLPISHRQKSTKTIFECSLRPSDIASSASPMLDFKDVKEGELYTAFVNNFGPDCLWVSISPAVRGRINLLDLATDVKTVAAIQQNYPLGSAIQCRCIKFVPSTKHLDLSERALTHKSVIGLNTLKAGVVLPARITRVTDSGLLAQLSDDVVGKISLTDISSTYTEQPTMGFQKNQLVQVTVKVVDIPNKKIALSLRSDQAAGSDPEISTIADLSLGQALKGYVKNVADQGLFVELGRDVVARVKIAEISDGFVKEWKTGFSVNQLVSGKVIGIDQKTKRVEFSLKKNAKIAPKQIGLSELEVGQVIEGTIKKIEDFGVFVQVNAVGVSGLCHKSEIADKPVKDISAVYSVGDLVKAKVLDINMEKRRISFGLKSSYFTNSSDSDSEMEDLEMSDGDDISGSDDDEVIGADEQDEEEDDDDDEIDEDEDMSADLGDESITSGATPAGDFDWSGKTVFNDPLKAELEDSGSEEDKQAKKKAKKAKKSYDDSATDFASKEPESVSDFERVVLGQPDSSFVWINYMAYHMQLSDFEAAREVGDRALKTINYRLEAEKLNVWMALLNLENNFGTSASLDATFKKSLEYNDPLDMYTRLVGTFIRSGKLDKAIETYNVMLSRFSASTAVWVEYATFLASHDKLEESRDLLPRALQALPKSQHVACLTKFGCLEFRRGEAERGRTLFEGLLSTYPKRLDLWNVLIDMEATQVASGHTVRELFDRVLSTKLSMKQAKSMFKKWFAYEKDHGGEDDVERVKARATQYVASHGV